MSKQRFIWGKSRLPANLKLDDYAGESHQVWLEIIDTLEAKNKRNPAFWFSAVSSRNPLETGLLYDLALLFCIKDNISKFHEYVLVVPTIAHANILTQLAQELSSEVRFDIEVKIKANWIESVKKYLKQYSYLIIAPLLAMRRRKASLKKIKPSRSINKDVWFIDTYVDLDDQTNLRPDRYFKGIARPLLEKEDVDLHWIYTPYGSHDSSLIAAKLDATGNKWVHKEAYLKLNDYILPALYPVLIACLRYPAIFFSNIKINLSPLLRYHNKQSRFEFMNAYGMLCVLFVKRLLQAGFKPQVFIDWFENQAMDRGLQLGFSRYSKNTNRIGYQVYQPQKNLFHFYCTDTEQNAGVSPRVIASPGESAAVFQQFLSKAPEAIKIPAYRVHEEFRKKEYSNLSTGKNLEPLVALPLTPDHIDMVLQRLDFTGAKLKDKNKTGIGVRIHPQALDNLAIKRIQDSGFVVSNKSASSLPELLQQTGFLITTVSQVALDALAIGCPVLIVADASQINYHPVPAFALGSCCRVAYADQDFYEEYLHLMKFRNSEQNNKKLSEIARRIREDYYVDVWPGHVDDFINSIQRLAHDNK